MTPPIPTPGPSNPRHGPGVARPLLALACLLVALSAPLAASPTVHTPQAPRAAQATVQATPRATPSAASRSHIRPALPVPTARINARRARTSSARTGHYPADRASVERVIRAAASSAHVSPDGMVALAWCESRLNPLSRSSCCLGLFQQHERYYRARFAKYGRGGRAWQDAEAQSHVAAGMVRDGMLAHWSCSAAYRRAA